MARFVQPASYKQIGTIKKIKGLNGTVIVSLVYPNITLRLTMVYLLRDYTYVPYQVGTWQRAGKYVHVRLKHIADRTEAEVWRDHAVFADAAVVYTALASTDLGFVGYVVKDVVHGLLGCVTYVEEGLQSLLHVERAGKQLFIPLHDTFVKGIDREQQTITTHLPLGYFKSVEVLD